MFLLLSITHSIYIWSICVSNNLLDIMVQGWALTVKLDEADGTSGVPTSLRATLMSPQLLIFSQYSNLTFTSDIHKIIVIIVLTIF